MEFTGLHHITMITGDAQENARFYGDLLGLRLVKKTVNFDQPQAYHLYFGDETGAAGLDPDVVRVPRGGTRPRRRGIDPHAAARGRRRGRARLLGAASRRDHPGARRPALRGLRRAQARAASSLTSATRRWSRATRTSRRSTRSRACTARAPTRSSTTSRTRSSPSCSASPTKATASTCSTAATASSASPMTRRPTTTSRAPAASTTSRGPPTTRTTCSGRSASPTPAGSSPTCATATTSSRSTSASRAACCSRSRRSRPGFAVDEDPDHLGEALRLPKQHEHLRAQLEQTLRPVNNPRVLA